MLIISIVFMLLHNFNGSNLQTCEAVTQAKLQANPKAFLMQSDGNIVEVAKDGTPYGTVCRD